LGEAWKRNALPKLLKKKSFDTIDSGVAYLLVAHQEGTLSSLLELVFYYPDALESVQEDLLAEMAQWACTKLALLPETAAKAHKIHQKPPMAMLQATKNEELTDWAVQADFSSSICAITILRYILDALPSLSPSLTVLLTEKNDLIMLVVTLLHTKPWICPRSDHQHHNNKNTIWLNGQWMPLTDPCKLSTPAAQAWLIIYSLLGYPACQCRLDLQNNESRRETVLSLRPLLTPLLIDQLPVLAAVQRGLEEMALMIGEYARSPDLPALDYQGSTNSSALHLNGSHSSSTSNAEAAKKKVLIVEMNVGVREKLMNQTDWNTVAATIYGNSSQGTHNEAARRRLVGMLETVDMIKESGELSSSLSSTDKKNNENILKIHVYYCVDDMKSVNLADITSNNSSSSSSSSSSCRKGWMLWTTYHLPLSPHSEEVAACNNDNNSVLLRRQKLQKIGKDDTAMKPLPSVSRFVVVYKGEMVCESVVELPCVEMKDDVASLSGTMWLTIGKLADKSKVIVQLKVGKSKVKSVKDPGGRGWCVYSPVGGAVSWRVGEE
jgi:hypothetical protein